MTNLQQKINSIAKSSKVGLACLITGLSLGLTGCEEDSSTYSSDTNTTNTANSDFDSSSNDSNSNNDSPSSNNNDGDGDSVSLAISGGHMYNGERIDVTATLRAGRVYNVDLICSNDGDSDTINVYAQGNKIGSYQTEENRMEGNGWYVDQRASIGRLTATSKNVVFTIETITDSWGTWPKELEINEVK